MTCSLCDKPVEARGWCKMHHTRWLRHGDPNVVIKDRVADPTYRTVHSRLVTRRGSAADYPCVDCQQPARDWSYKNGSGGMPYSTNLDDYEPRCRSCHINLDKTQRVADRNAQQKERSK